MNIAEHLVLTASWYPEKTALVYDTGQWTYAELDGLSQGAAQELLKLGVGKGDRVALLLPNQPAFVVWYYAVLRIGAVAVSLSTRLTPGEAAFMIDDCGASVLIVQHEDGAQELERAGVDEAWSTSLPNSISSVVAVNGANRFTVCDAFRSATWSVATMEVLGEAESTEVVFLEPDDPAVILYTSGTTGFAKGATLSHGNVRATVHAFNHLCQMGPADQLLLSVPLFHCYGQNAILNSGFNIGATVILQQRFDLDEAVRLIQTHQVNRLFGVPTTFQLLMDYCQPEDLASVEYCFSAATTLPPQVGESWQQKFGMPIYEGYGLTETAPFASYNHRQRFIPGSIGTPVDLVEMKIVDTETGEACSPGELGEIAIRGPNVMLGYWNRPKETSEAIRDGWFYSGDIGRIDEYGFFYIVDRVKDMISIGGMKVFPAEVERVLLDFPGLVDVAVVGLPDETMGEKVVAFVVLAKDVLELDRAGLKQFCQKELAAFKTPQHFEVVDELPRNPSGKVLKKELRKRTLGTGVNPAGPQTAPFIDFPPEQGEWVQQLKTIHEANVQRWAQDKLLEEIAELMGAEVGEVSPQQTFVELGMDSLMIVGLRDRVQLKLGPKVELPATLVFDYPRPIDLAGFLVDEIRNRSDSSGKQAATKDSIAQSTKPCTPVKPPHTVPRKTQDVGEMTEEEALAELMKEIDQA